MWQLIDEAIVEVSDTTKGDSSAIAHRNKFILILKTMMPLLFVLLDFKWHDLINPQFYIEWGGLWVLLFVIFAETGLFAGFFFPGDSLLFVAGIYSDSLASQLFPPSNEFIDLILL